MRVRVSPAAHKAPTNATDLTNLAYVIGVAIGDGNLSSPNGRVSKLRVTCDVKYPKLIDRITRALEIALPENIVNSIQRPKNCIDVYVHSNKLEDWLGWKVGLGPKHVQNVHVPAWIKEDLEYTKVCLKGLFETDGSVYTDRGYLMSMFTTVIEDLANDVYDMICLLQFTSHVYKIKEMPPKQTRYNIRVSKNTKQFIKTIKLVKN